MMPARLPPGFRSRSFRLGRESFMLRGEVHFGAGGTMSVVSPCHDVGRALDSPSPASDFRHEAIGGADTAGIDVGG